MKKCIKFDNESFHWIIDLKIFKFKIKDKKRIKKFQEENKVKFDAIPIEKNKIVFSNYFGKSYGCNPKYIAEEIIKQNLPYDLVWIVRDVESKRNEFPPQVRLVEYLSDESIHELASAKIWIDNTRKKTYWERGLVKKEGQVYFQTWHGPLGIKKIEGAFKNENPMWRKWAKVDSKNIDCLLASNETDEKILKKCFWYNGKIARTGYPRNDIFFSSDEVKNQIKNEVKSKLNIPENKKIVLYLPTFRDVHRIQGYDVDIKAVISAVNKKFEDDYCAVVKLHPNTRDEIIELFDFENENVVDAIGYPDVQELIIASDIIVTDYSSAIFDGMLEYKKGFFFVSDYELYKKERGFYFPLEDTPFSVAKTNQQLIDNIDKFDSNEYRRNIEKYLKDKKYILDDKSSWRFVESIKSVIGEV